MKADTEAAINAFGKNKQVKRVFQTLFITTAGLVLAPVVDPVTALSDLHKLLNFLKNLSSFIFTGDTCQSKPITGVMVAGTDREINI